MATTPPTSPQTISPQPISPKTIAFIGLGVMGEAMCRNLAKKGTWSVAGFDMKPGPGQRLKADGVTPAASMADAVATAVRRWRP